MPTTVFEQHMYSFSVPKANAPISLGALTGTSSPMNSSAPAYGADDDSAVVTITTQTDLFSSATNYPVSPITMLHTLSTQGTGYRVDVEGTIAPRQIELNGSNGLPGDLITQTAGGPVWSPEFYSTYCNLLVDGDIRAENEWFSCFLHVEDGFTQYIDMGYAEDNNLTRPYNFVLPTGLDPARRHCFRLLVIDNYSSLFWKIFEEGSNQAVGYTVIWLGGSQILTVGGRWQMYEVFTLNGGSTWFCSMIPGGSFD